MRAAEFITEASTLTLWHGGNLTDNLSLISQKKGRFEYGSGLYATTHYGTAIKYAKGSRKLYRIALNQGNSANDHSVDYNDAINFVDQYVLKAKRTEVKQRMEKYHEGNGISAYIFNNIILNNDAIKPTNTRELSQFLVNQGIDYLLVPNAFGWGEMMVVIFNLNKIASVARVMPKEKIDQFDLPAEFAESFTSKVPYEVTRATENEFETRAIIGDRVVVFGAESIFGNEHPSHGIWSMAFYERQLPNQPYRGDKFGKTGSGNELQVFSFVIDSTKELISRYQPTEIKFTSSKADENRTSLYTRLIKKFPNLGYTFIGTRTRGYDDEFVIKRNNTVNEAFYSDIPNEDWLQDQIDYAVRKGRNGYGVPYMGKVTGYSTTTVEVPVSILKRLPGMRGEQNNVRQDDLKAIMRIMRETGKLPTKDNGQEYAPFINVAYNGEAWVNEGNHRIMAAAALGWETLPIEIKYFDGGERIEDSPLAPSRIGLL